MKKLFSLLVLMLALNFLAAAGGIGWMFQSGKLNKEKVTQIKKVIFPDPATVAPPVKDTRDPATTRPMFRLDQLVAQQSGKPASEQVEFIQHAVDTQRLEMDQRQRILTDLKTQVDLANQKLATDRAALEKEKTALQAREQESTRLQTDKGFQDSLALYIAMPSKQVKTVFMTLKEPVVQQYLETMDTRTASKIIKEFKTPDETAFIEKVLERMRLAQASLAEPAPASGKQP